MNSKALVSAALATAAVALWSVAYAPSPAAQAFPTEENCLSLSCDVTVYHDLPFSRLSVAETVYVSAKAGDIVTITWTLKSLFFTRFDAGQGIVFQDPNWTCQAVDGKTQVYTCIGKNLEKNKKYKYTIYPRGIFAPGRRDPYIQNG